MKPLTKIAKGRTGIERQFSRPKVTPAMIEAGEGVIWSETTGMVVPTTDWPARLATKVFEVMSAASAAVKKSRAKNPEAYRAYQRDYMRKRRAKAKP